MTEKQEKILKVALEMFAGEGFNAVSTSAIAKKACVSEGLIFRHFTNKDGLLAAILEQGMEQANKLYADIIFESDPKTLILKTIELPMGIDKSDYAYWRLLYSLKWQQGKYDDSKSEPLRNALVGAFQKLGYNFPKAEADLLLVYIDGIATYMLLHEHADAAPTIELLKSKYNK